MAGRYHTTQRDHSFNIPEFAALAEKHATCIGWEPLPAVFASLKVSNSVRLSMEHYNCLFSSTTATMTTSGLKATNWTLNGQRSWSLFGKTWSIDLVGQTYRSQECPRNIRGAYIQAYLVESDDWWRDRWSNSVAWPCPVLFRPHA